MPVSPRIEDFVHPGFKAGDYANTDLPLSASDDPRRPERRLRLGAPVFEAASRLSGRARFIESPGVGAGLVEHVAAQRRRGLLRACHMAARAGALLDARPEGRRGAFETAQQTREAIRDELALSKELLEVAAARQDGPPLLLSLVRGLRLADQLAAEAGYRTVHGGIDVRRQQGAAMPLRVQRISEEYLFRLPGEGRGGIAPVWLNRVRGSRGEERARAVITIGGLPAAAAEVVTRRGSKQDTAHDAGHPDLLDLSAIGRRGFEGGRSGHGPTATMSPQIARWSEAAGCEGILVYTDNRLVDPWLIGPAHHRGDRAALSAGRGAAGLHAPLYGRQDGRHARLL